MSWGCSIVESLALLSFLPVVKLKFRSLWPRLREWSVLRSKAEAGAYTGDHSEMDGVAQPANM